MNVPERITLYLPSLRGGGAERVMVTLANGFARRGHAVDLVLARAEGPYLKNVSENVRLVDLKAQRVATSLLGLVRYLRRERPAALLSALNHANVIAIAAHRLARVPTRLVVSERNTLSNAVAVADTRRARMMPLLMRASYPLADSVVAVSEGTAEDLAKTIGLSREKIEVIYNPVVSSERFGRAEAPVDHPWFAPGAPPVIIGVGRLTPAKDFPTLLRAFARLRESQSARLVILGEGGERDSLEALARELQVADYVSLPGFVENPFAWMRRSAVFVLSSRFEGLPGVLIEAMACGVPVVSTDCPSGPAEILENGKWGRLVAVGDVVGLAEAIKATLREPVKVGVARRALDFDVDRAVDRYLAALKVAG